NVGREERLHVRMMRLKMTVERLRRLVASVAREHYVTTPEDLEKMKNLHQEGVLKDMGEMALALFYQLQPPGTGEDGLDPLEQSRRAAQKIREIFGLDSDEPPVVRVAATSSQPQECEQGVHAAVAPDFSPAHGGLPTMSEKIPVAAPQPAKKESRYPNITVAEWEARERPRQLLENLLHRQVEACEAQRRVMRKESIAGPSPYERAAEIAPTHPNAQVMRRMQDSNL